jgi:hypothetical protein
MMERWPMWTTDEYRLVQEIASITSMFINFRRGFRSVRIGV